MKHDESRHVRAFPAAVSPTCVEVTVRLADPETERLCLNRTEWTIAENSSQVLDCDLKAAMKPELVELERSIRKGSDYNMSLIDVTFMVETNGIALSLLGSKVRILDGPTFKDGRIIDDQYEIDVLVELWKAKLQEAANRRKRAA